LSIAKKEVIADPAIDDICTKTTFDCINALITRESIIFGTARYLIIARAAIDEIRLTPSEDGIIPFPAIQDVIALVSPNLIISIATIDRVPCIRGL
jgi:hypothetical protein